MFYVDLEPKENKKEIYNLQCLNNMKINVEPPNKKKHHFTLHSMPTLQSHKNLLHETLQMCEMRRKPYDNRMPKTEIKHLLNLPYARVNIMLTTRTVHSTRTYKTQEVNR